jgi:hypothetical protein
MSMSEFINTIDVLGDDAVIDSIIQRTITEFKDNRVETVGRHAFYGCTALERVELPRVKKIDTNAFANCTALTAFIIRNWDWVPALASLDAFVADTPIYIPEKMMDSYKSATTWSAKSNLRPLEQYTIDGTAMSELTTVFYVLNTKLTKVKLSNYVTEVGPRYYATLTSATTESIEEVVITMSGVDITADVYNAETGEISIPVVTGALRITARAGTGTVSIEPPAFELNGSDFVNAGNPTTLNGMTLEGFDYTETSGSDGLGNIVTSGKERIQIPKNVVTNSVTFAEGFTIAFKTTVTNTAQTQKYMCVFSMVARQFAVIYGYVSKTFELYDSSVGSFRSGSQIVVNNTEEHLIAYTHDGSKVCCYLDGSLVNSFTCVYDWSGAHPNETSYILGSANINNCFIGKLANFSVWNKALSADEIAILFT